MCSTHALLLLILAVFFLFHINEGEDIREGKAFVSNCVVMILFSKQMTYKGMQDTRWEMDHGSDKGSNFFDDRPTGLKQTLVIKWN